MRASAAGGFGPRDLLGRKSSVNSSPRFCRVRPVAHPPEVLRAWATRPATQRVAKAKVFGRSQRRTNIKAEAASKRRCASPPRLGAAGRPLTRGLRAIRSQFELGQRFNPSHHPNPSPMLGPARRKTAIGFPARRTIAAQSSPQFSAPCPPHCGSAVAPPVPLGTRKMGVSTLKCRPRQFLPDWPSTNRQNMPFQTGGRRSFCE